MNFKSFLSLVTLLLPLFAQSIVRPNALFSDGMVVQRNSTIPVWGWADPDEKITIETSWGEKAETVALADSSWRVSLKTPDAGGPFQITIAGENRLVINDVLSGEVWLCTGQSNMDFAMEKFLGDAREEKYQPLVEYFRNEVATANDPWLRHIEVPQTTSVYGQKKNFEGNWVSATPADIGKITATGYFFAKELREKLNVPVALVECSWGGTRIQPWLSEKVYQTDEGLKEYFEHSRYEIAEQVATMGDPESYVDTSFQRRFDKWKESGQNTSRPYPIEHPLKNKQIPATLHNAMISAIVPYAIKGVLWYQGESNSHFLENEYEKYFKLLITSWREEWGLGDIPFYWTQLAGYEVPDERSDLGWAMVNDYLRRGLDLPNTGMAVLHDIGEAKDVHPHNKMDAGKRLSLWALKDCYGFDIPVVSGPLYKSSSVAGNKMVIEFLEVGSGLMVGKKELMADALLVDEPLKWFQICGPDGIWKNAEAKIIGTNQVEVFHPEVEHPQAVRYAWSSNPEGANLYNQSGLPAAVFTTQE
ncbi:sialate O-acetylesterase [Mangrovibacterium sp.]|uniref:sialate O-acetylesterase n=1 Tax=Mangrovibacterium sp. TaxID=1961364 RepID=UPI003568F8DD